jgi:hypothetical protein
MASKAKDFLDIIKDIRGTNFTEEGMPKEGFWYDVKTWRGEVATELVQVTNIKNYASEWANKAENSLISFAAGGDDNSFSALHHAKKAAISASNSASSAMASANSANTATNAASAANASSVLATNSATSANTSANTAVTSASAAVIARNYASDWAQKGEDVLVNDGVNPSGFSAYHWAQKAQAIVGGVGSFLDLTDTPGTYTGHESKFLQVGTGNNIQFVNLTSSNVGLGNCNNTSDANKPISNATQVALDLKANTAFITGFATAMAIALG